MNVSQDQVWPQNLEGNPTNRASFSLVAKGNEVKLLQDEKNDDNGPFKPPVKALKPQQRTLDTETKDKTCTKLELLPQVICRLSSIMYQTQSNFPVCRGETGPEFMFRICCQRESYQIQVACRKQEVRVSSGIHKITSNRFFSPWPRSQGWLSCGGVSGTVLIEKQESYCGRWCVSCVCVWGGLLPVLM